jgi:hypothetical protein
MASTVGLFDMIRTKLMNQTNTNKAYTGFIHCFVKIVKQNGIRGFYMLVLFLYGQDLLEQLVYS